MKDQEGWYLWSVKPHTSTYPTPRIPLPADAYQAPSPPIEFHILFVLGWRCEYKHNKVCIMRCETVPPSDCRSNPQLQFACYLLSATALLSHQHATQFHTQKPTIDSWDMMRQDPLL